MENRRDFFKAVGLFAAGVVGAKVASYTPKKKEEEMQVAESVAVFDKDGNEYNMVVVPKKKEEKKPEPVITYSSHSLATNNTKDSYKGYTMAGSITATHIEPRLVIHQSKEVRKLNS